jgi:uncharacterized protein YqeY
MSNNSLHAGVRAEISRHLTAAVKGRDRVSINALRAALCALDNATAVVARRELARADIEALLLAEAEEHAAAAAEYERLGHAQRADCLRHEAAIIRGTLEHLAAVDTRDAS